MVFPLLLRAPKPGRAQRAFWLLALAACGGQSAEPVAGPQPATAEPAAVHPRSDDPRVVQARQALDLGRADLALALVPQAVGVAGTEGPLLEARLAALSGDRLAALAHLERARREAPGDPRVYATAAEIHAAEGNLEEADREIQRGVKAAGAAGPELTRARGVQLICSPGQARHGLALLLRARELDAGLPFIDRPLGQAHMLVAKQEIGAGKPAAALVSVRRSLEHDPEDLDTRRLEVEILMGLGQWGAGIANMEALLLEGLPLEAELSGYCKNAGFWAVTHGQRELGLKHYLRALQLGFPRAELGHGLSVLRAEAERLADEGARSLAAGAGEQARDLLERALVCDPDCLQAHNHLGHLHHDAGNLERAVSCWNRVVDLARAASIELPEPVHIKLARVQALGLGEFEKAHETLEAYLVLEPTGRWVDQTRKLVAVLPQVSERESQQQAAGAGEDGRP
jgi:tetratricopeptide (TPR) repeat protein